MEASEWNLKKTPQTLVIDVLNSNLLVYGDQLLRLISIFTIVSLSQFPMGIRYICPIPSGKSRRLLWNLPSKTQICQLGSDLQYSISELIQASPSKRDLVHNNPYENSCERMDTKVTLNVFRKWPSTADSSANIWRVLSNYRKSEFNKFSHQWLLTEVMNENAD